MVIVDVVDGVVLRLMEFLPIQIYHQKVKNFIGVREDMKMGDDKG